MKTDEELKVIAQIKDNLVDKTKWEEEQLAQNRSAKLFFKNVSKLDDSFELLEDEITKDFSVKTWKWEGQNNKEVLHQAIEGKAKKFYFKKKNVEVKIKIVKHYPRSGRTASYKMTLSGGDYFDWRDRERHYKNVRPMLRKIEECIEKNSDKVEKKKEKTDMYTSTIGFLKILYPEAEIKKYEYGSSIRVDFPNGVMVEYKPRKEDGKIRLDFYDYDFRTLNPAEVIEIIRNLKPKEKQDVNDKS